MIMFELTSDPYKITSLQTSNIRGINGTPPYNIGLSGIGMFVQTDAENGVYYPEPITGSYVAIFWAKDAKNALARCFVKIEN